MVFITEGLPPALFAGPGGFLLVGWTFAVCPKAWMEPFARRDGIGRAFVS